ncbi:MAG: Glucosamine/fructose-6-phosphate aminotransferase, isomerizing [Candidatus Roizmanbacteria bacterium GW2011_GWA2_37_7]|uniref:Glutamine--fructose-6-phosphate aminotransferase [isomerizing] n=1 Tax=Candidatus Roizmanbacteria bacterium GW2011_GWA2_37_7 TaxID=1618481 RepID=A0A0G0KBV8_9BACT|nr:MAG: Glucosamine/fructose-6-phosphate aminotransferase, isomerizing [Candidatus Roizmanbacteria bacterium GW2011_GWA2_37_7]
MCGIFGYLGNNQHAGALILDGLKALEYRGYDSWGVAIKKADGTVFIEKHTGKIGNASLPVFQSHIGIGHTRWATHGGVTNKNAHPHVDCSKKIAIVHNGIVENFKPLKSHLIQKKHIFTSETDSEVIAHLIEEIHTTEPDLVKVMQRLRSKIHGMNAIIAFFPEYESFYIIKNGSPIVVGVGNKEFFIASDTSAIIPHTKRIYFLEDEEMLELTKSGIRLYNNTGMKKKISYSTITYSAESAQKGSYDHFMLKEISEQPQILKNIIDTKKREIIQAAQIIKKAYGTYLIGCGTASYACLAGTYLFSKIAHRHINFAISSEFSYLVDFLKDSSLVFALSQSGETIDTISSVKKAKEKNAKLLSLTNSRGSTLYRMSDYNLLLHAGPEKAVASTKAYTAKIAFLYLIAHKIAKTYSLGEKNLTKAIDEVTEIIFHKSKIQSLSSKIKDHQSIFILGRGVSYAAALESALKIKEVSYIHAEGFAAGELKHGVIALIEKDTPVILFNPEDETYDDTLSAAHEVKARGAHVIGVSSRNDDVYDTYIEVKNCGDATIIPNVVIAQLLGYYLSLSKGHDPDKPRNLAKSVTVK